MNHLTLDDLYEREQHIGGVLDEIESEVAALNKAIRDIDSLYDAANIAEVGGALTVVQSAMIRRMEVLDSAYCGIEAAHERFLDAIGLREDALRALGAALKEQ